MTTHEQVSKVHELISRNTLPSKCREINDKDKLIFHNSLNDYLAIWNSYSRLYGDLCNYVNDKKIIDRALVKIREGVSERQIDLVYNYYYREYKASTQVD